MGGEGIKLRYNHYNQSFPCTDGVLKWEDVDDAYAISFVFQVKPLCLKRDTIDALRI